MSWNNVIPAWVMSGNAIISDYHARVIDLHTAETKLDELGVPPSMKKRLYKEPKQREKE